METIMEDLELNRQETELIIGALNLMWNEAHELLQRKGLGDIQKENLEWQKTKSKELMLKLEHTIY